MIKVLCNDFKKFINTRAERVIDALTDNSDFFKTENNLYAFVEKKDIQSVNDANAELINIAVYNAYARGFLDGITISDRFNS